MPEEFEITITSPEPPAGGTNVMARYANVQIPGTFSLTAVTETVVRLRREMYEIEPSQAALEQHGAALYQALFADAIAQAFRTALSIAQERDSSIRLRIYAKHPVLLVIPWEYLYDPQQRWCVLHPKLSLVRSLLFDNGPTLSSRAPKPVAELLRVLVMLASPTDLPALDTAQELANLQTATTTAAIELIAIEPTYAALQTALRQKPHVFHFVGHGFFPAEAGAAAQGSLVFCREDDGKADLIGADRVVPLLAGCESLGLVLLNACEGAVAGDHSPFAGLAQRLLQQGVPAVIAMQAPILDDDAVRFSREFYAALGDGYGIEQAVDEGRMRIHGTAYTWGIPAFYLLAQEPFTIPQLTAAQKADRLWQKSHTVQELAARRHLLEAALALDPNHAGAQAGLKRLESEVEAAAIYDAALAYIDHEAWRDAYRSLQQLLRLLPNYRETRSLLAEVLGQLSGEPPIPAVDPLAQVEQYRPLLSALLEGRLSPFLGDDVSSVGQPAADRWVQGLYPPRTGDVAKALADHLPAELQHEGSLLRVSQYTLLLDGEYALYDRLSSLYEGNFTPTVLHRLLAEIPKRLADRGHPKSANRRYVLFSTAYDDLLERAFIEAEQPFHLFAYRPRFVDDNGVTQTERFLHIPPVTGQTGTVNPVEVLEPNRYNGHDSDTYPIIVKLCGRRVTADPDSVTVTEDQFINYISVENSLAVLPTTLLNQLKRHSFLFFGHSLEPWHLRLLWQRLRLPAGPRQPPKWAIVPTLSAIEERFWRSQQVEPIVARTEGVVAYVNKQLESL